MAAVGRDRHGRRQKHPGYVIGTSGESFSHWVYLWADQSRSRPEREYAPHQLHGYALHPHGEPARPSDSERDRTAAERVDARLRQEVRRSGQQGPDDAGADLERALRFDQTLHVPAGQITAAMPLQWNNEQIITGQVGWPVDHREALEEPGGGCRLRRVGDDGLQSATDDVQDGEARLPGVRTARFELVASLARDPYFAADPGPAMQAAAGLIWKGSNIVTVRISRCGQHRGHATRRRQVAEFAAAWARYRHGQAAQAAGYQVTH